MPSAAAQRRLAVLERTLGVRTCAAAGSLPFTKLLVANRGEIAIRICRAARELGLATVSIATSQDASSMHTQAADELVMLADHASGDPIAPYLSVDAVIRHVSAVRHVSLIKLFLPFFAVL